jgi:lipid II:glycine glycyltransferase (peptidoglycan interpeptide bridge formation enzyme)
MIPATTRDQAPTVLSDAEFAEWDAAVEQAPTGHMHQCTWWATPLARYGIRTHVVACRDPSGRLAAGALLRALPFPLLGVCLLECLDGPIVFDAGRRAAPMLVDGIAALARAERAVAVSLRGARDPVLLDDLTRELSARRLTCTRTPAVREAVLEVGGRDLAAVRAGYQTRTRRAIRKALAHGARVAPLSGETALKEAHATWLATADRKGFTDVRPWPALAPLLTDCLRRGRGTVYGSLVGDRVVAAIFVTFIGRTAHYVYGGFHEDAAKFSPTHALHDAAIAEAHARGLPVYCLGTLLGDGSPGQHGLDDFKLSFGARAVRQADTLTWERMPHLHRGIQRLRYSGVGEALLRFWRERLIGRSGEAVAADEPRRQVG